MENASKALLMAAGILIALMILGALIFMFIKVGEFQSQSDNLTKQSQIAQFNNEFEPYNGKNLTLMDLKSLYLKIESNNRKNDSYEISVNGNAGIEAAVTNILNEKMRNTRRSDGSSPTSTEINNYVNLFFNDFKNGDLETYKRLKVFARCTGLDFNGEEGRINNVLIEAAN